MTEHFASYVSRCTVPITAEVFGNPDSGSSGSSFLFGFPQGDVTWPGLITNRHVVQNGDFFSFQLQTKTGDAPPSGPGVKVVVDRSELKILFHPDPIVDLAFIAWPAIFKACVAQHGIRPIGEGLGPNLIPRGPAFSGLNAVEKVVMIGYPDGILDTYNNRPIIRHGSTATDPRLDYDGKKEFLIDIATFPGSSGSPVCVAEEGMIATPTGFSIGSRHQLIGILYAGHAALRDGVVIGDRQDAVEVGQMAHLGICIRAERIFDFLPEIQMIAADERARGLRPEGMP